MLSVLGSIYNSGLGGFGMFPQSVNPYSAIVLLFVFWLSQREITHKSALYTLLFFFYREQYIHVRGFVHDRY